MTGDELVQERSFVLLHRRAVHPLRMRLVQRQRLLLGHLAHLAVPRDQRELREVVDRDHRPVLTSLRPTSGRAFL
jgi:hypothetical protein